MNLFFLKKEYLNTHVTKKYFLLENTLPIITCYNKFKNFSTKAKKKHFFDYKVTKIQELYIKNKIKKVHFFN